MKSKTNIKAGGLSTINHNQSAALPIRTNIKAGGLSTINHNQTAR